MPGDGSLKAEGDGRQRRSHHHRLDVRPRNRGSIQCVVCLARLGRLKRRRKMTEPWPGLLPLLNWRRNCRCAYLQALGCPWVSPGTPQACSGFRPAAFGSFVISQAHAGAPIPVGSHRQADSSNGRRTVALQRNPSAQDGKPRYLLNRAPFQRIPPYASDVLRRVFKSTLRAVDRRIVRRALGDEAHWSCGAVPGRTITTLPPAVTPPGNPHNRRM